MKTTKFSAATRYNYIIKPEILTKSTGCKNKIKNLIVK